MKKSTEAVQSSGVVHRHAEGILTIARRKNTVIFVRSVNLFATSLIAEGYATKGLKIKGKSADWGPQAGFICENQALSKLARKDPTKADKFNQKVKQSLADNDCCAVPLIITNNRFLELLKQNIIHTINVSDHVHTITSVGLPHQQFLLYPHRKMATGHYPLLNKKYTSLTQSMFNNMPALRNGYWVMTKIHHHQDWLPVTVLADKDSKLPLTADYDLFSVCPHLSAFNPGQKPRLQDALKAVKQSLGQTSRRNSDPDLGLLSSLTTEVIGMINCYSPQKIVHHGCEVDNPVTELDYPVTVFTPWGVIVGAENQCDLEMIVRDIIRLGYVFYANRFWSQMGNVVSTKIEKLDCHWNDRVQENEYERLEVFNKYEIESLRFFS